MLHKMAKEKRLPKKTQIFDANNQLLFPDDYFNAAYLHMLLNMGFSLHELHFIFSEIRRVLKSKIVLSLATYEMLR
jgi:ubiquinone/menaquinone biosynthesis C-methylase UbiE